MAESLDDIVVKLKALLNDPTATKQIKVVSSFIKLAESEEEFTISSPEQFEKALVLVYSFWKEYRGAILKALDTNKCQNKELLANIKNKLLLMTL